MAKKNPTKLEEEVPQLSDATLFRLWEERNEIEKRIDKLNKARKTRDDKILTEFERRGIKSITSAETGERITYVQGTSVVYDYDSLVTSLRRSAKGRAIVERCQKTVIDTKAIAAEVNAGHINPELVRKYSGIKHSAPYLRGGKVET